MTSLFLIDYVLLGIVFAIATLMLLPRFRNTTLWRATVTPLASIIGSGFLVIAPLLAGVAGAYSLGVMVLVVMLAYAIGYIIRYNICHSENLKTYNDAGPFLAGRFLIGCERFSHISLSIAYVISIAFYLRLLSSFVLSVSGNVNEVYAQIITTVILCSIAGVGWFRGLFGLESLETISVTIKLAIIGGLLFGLLHYGYTNGMAYGDIETNPMPFTDRLRMIAGMLLVVQGFETSRYLGQEYDVKMRIKSMRLAQITSALIYIVFILLIMPLLHLLEGEKPDETAIITLSSQVSAVLPWLLVVAAVMSQFSAAIADTLGAGGLFTAETAGKISTRLAYVLITGVAILLVWTANIFEIVSLASRAFAMYYCLQALIALQVRRKINKTARAYDLQGLFFSVMVLILLSIVLFAIPVE